MAIIIPSKHIYSKNFDPVIDNNIDKVEVKANKAKIIGETEEVYSENFNNTFIDGFSQQSQDADKFVSYSGTFNHKIGIVSVVYVQIRPTYITKTIKVPETQYNKKVLSVLGGTDEYNNPNITTHIIGTIEKGTVNGTISMAISSESPAYPLLGYGIGIKEHNEISKKNGGYTLTHENNTYKVETTAITQSGNRTLTASVTLNNEDNVLNSNFSKVEENGEVFFVCTLTCLSGLLVEKFAVEYNIDVTIEPNQTSFNLSIPIEENSIENSYEIYTPQTIDISANGETIKLDLQDETITIGNGNKTYSFEGNELIQTTNTPSIESKYQSIIDSWKNGKQTVVITCPIADYYDENGNLVVSPEEISLPINIAFRNNIATTTEYKLYEINSSVPLEDDDILKYNNEYATYYFEGDYYVLKIKTGGEFDKKTTSTDFFPVFKIRKLPFCFKEGDTVIPYTYTNQGDKPLSYNKDFTPKQFTVIGTKISKKQGVTQELTLQEV